MPDDASDDPLAAIGAAVVTPDLSAQAAAADALSTAAEGAASGRLAEYGQWLAGVFGAWPVPPMTRIRAVIFTAEPTEPVEPIEPVEPTEPGRALDEIADVGSRTVADSGPHRSAGPADRSAMAAAVARGVQVADEEIDAGAELLIVAVASSRPLHAALAAVAVLTNAEPAKVMDRGLSATDPDTWMADALAVRDLRRAAFAQRSQAGALLTALGSTQLAEATGCVLQASARRTGVVLDGLTAAAAALIARDSAPLAVSWWLAADTAPGPGYELAITRLGLRPVLDLGLARADGTAGALCVPILRAAAAQHR